MFESWFPQEMTTLRKLLWFRTAWEKAGPPPTPSDPLNTFVGSIVRFFSNRALPVVKLEANFTPIQSLNGQEAPWPPGGGKNKIDGSTNVAGAIITSTGGVNGVAMQEISITLWIPVEPNTTYTHSGCGNVNSYASKRGAEYESQDIATFTKSIEGASGSGTFTTGANTHYVRLNVLTANNGSCQLEVGSTATAWSPYSNECPISGHTGAVVVRTGKNLFDPTTIITGKFVRAGNVSASNPLGSETSNAAFNCSGYVRVKPSTNYVTELPGYTEAAAAGLVFFGAQTVESAISGVPTNAQRSNKYAFTTPVNCNYIRFSWSNNVGLDPNYPYPQLEESTTPTDYEPYSGTSVTVSFGQTVYGGTLTVNEDGSGQIVATHALWTKNTATMDNADATPGWKNSGIKDLIGSGVNAEFSNQIMNIGKYFSANTNGTNDILFLRTARYNKTQTEWIALAIDVQIAVELASPVTIPLTASQINTLIGENNVWVDAATGDITVQAYGTEIS